MSKGKTKAKTQADVVDWPACQLMLQIEPGPGAKERLTAALGAAKAAAVLIRPKRGDKLGAGEVKPLVALAQAHGAAAILYEDAELAKAMKADGVHIASDSGVADHVRSARAILGAEASIGVEASTSRHLAMTAGEAGADYVAFGAASRTEEGRAVRDGLIAWWAEIFEVPCVAMDLESADEVEIADSDGADFAALVVPTSASRDDIAGLVGDAYMRLNQSGTNGE